MLLTALPNRWQGWVRIVCKHLDEYEFAQREQNFSQGSAGCERLADEGHLGLPHTAAKASRCLAATWEGVPAPARTGAVRDQAFRGSCRIRCIQTGIRRGDSDPGIRGVDEYVGEAHRRRAIAVGRAEWTP